MNFQLKTMFQMVHVPGGNRNVPGARQTLRLPSKIGIIPSNQSLTDCASRDIIMQDNQKKIIIMTVVIILTKYKQTILILFIIHQI